MCSNGYLIQVWIDLEYFCIYYVFQVLSTENSHLTGLVRITNKKRKKNPWLYARCVAPGCSETAMNALVDSVNKEHIPTIEPYVVSYGTNMLLFKWEKLYMETANKHDIQTHKSCHALLLFNIWPFSSHCVVLTAFKYFSENLWLL